MDTSSLQMKLPFKKNFANNLQAAATGGFGASTSVMAHGNSSTVDVSQMVNGQNHQP